MKTRSFRPGLHGPGRVFILPALALLCALSLASCALKAAPPPGFVPPASRNEVSGAPFHAQDDFQCGPASLATSLNQLGDPVTPDEISRAIYKSEARGTLNLDLALYPRTRGFTTRWFAGTPADIVAAVDRNRVLIVMLNRGIRTVAMNHFVAVTGYAPDGVVVNDGYAKGRLIAWDAFWGDWDAAGRWTLEILPGKGAASSPAAAPAAAPASSDAGPAS